jgi:hypothetical protein
MPPSQFGWQDGGVGFAPEVEWANNNNWAGQGWFGFADFNGDGRQDFWFVNPGTSRVLVRLSTGTSFAPEVEWANNNNWADQGYFGFADFNGDGKQDFWFWNPGTSRVLVRLSTGTSFASEVEWANNNNNAGLGYFGYADFDGDGRQDFWFVNPSSSRILVRAVNMPYPDLLNVATTGLGATTTIVYTPLTIGGVYAKDTTSTYPVLDLQGPMYVVSSSNQSNGAGGSFVTNYFYTGAKYHQLARSSLGFRKVESTDAQSLLKTATSFRQDYPFQGLPLTVTTTQSSGAPLNQLSNSWTDNPLVNSLTYNFSTGKYHRSDLNQSVETSNDLNGAVLPTVTTTTSYDAYGNATGITVSTGDSYSKATTNTFTNDTANWFLGRLTRSQVTSTTP